MCSRKALLISVRQLPPALAATWLRNQARILSSTRMVMRVFPVGAGSIAPRFPLPGLQTVEFLNRKVGLMEHFSQKTSPQFFMFGGTDNVHR